MSSFSVLVADDSPIYRKLVEHALAEDSCPVSFASSGHQAIEIFEREHPDLVITDWVMPDLTGIELCQRIRTGAQSSYTYIVILTSNAGKRERGQGDSPQAPGSTT